MCKNYGYVENSKHSTSRYNITKLINKKEHVHLNGKKHTSPDVSLNLNEMQCTLLYNNLEVGLPNFN